MFDEVFQEIHLIGDNFVYKIPKLIHRNPGNNTPVRPLSSKGSDHNRRSIDQWPLMPLHSVFLVTTYTTQNHLFKHTAYTFTKVKGSRAVNRDPGLHKAEY